MVMVIGSDGAAIGMPSHEKAPVPSDVAANPNAGALTVAPATGWPVSLSVTRPWRPPWREAS